MRRTTDLVRILVLVGVLVHLGLIDDEVAAALTLLLFPSKVPTCECRVAAERLTYTITLICDNDKGGRGSKNPKISRTSYMEASLPWPRVIFLLLLRVERLIIVRIRRAKSGVRRLPFFFGVAHYGGKAKSCA